MANTVIPGLRFVGTKSGGDGPRIIQHTVASNNSNAIFTGSLVKKIDAGGVDVAGAGDTDLVGVCDGVDNYFDGTENRKGNYLPSGATWGTNYNRQTKLRVIDSRDALFEISADAALATPTQAGAEALIGSNGDVTAESGTTETGMSTQKLDVSTAETNDGSPASAQLRIEGIARRMRGAIDFTAANVPFIVSINEGFQAETDVTGQ